MTQEARPMQFLSGETYTGYEIWGPSVAKERQQSLYLLVGRSTNSFTEDISQCFDREEMKNSRLIFFWPREGIEDCAFPLIFCVNRNLYPQKDGSRVADASEKM